MLVHGKEHSGPEAHYGIKVLKNILQISKYEAADTAGGVCISPRNCDMVEVPPLPRFLELLLKFLVISSQVILEYSMELDQE